MNPEIDSALFGSKCAKRIDSNGPTHRKLSVSEDGRFLLISVVNGTDPHNRLYVADLGNVRTTMYMSTDADAPKYRIVAFDVVSLRSRNRNERRVRTAGVKEL